MGSTLHKLHVLAKILLPDFFSIGLVTYLLLIYLEEVFPGFVSYSVRPTTLLAMTILLGVASFPYLKNEKTLTGQNQKKERLRTLVGVLVIGSLCTLILYSELHSSGFLGSAVGIATGVLTIFLAFFLTENLQRDSVSHSDGAEHD